MKRSESAPSSRNAMRASLLSLVALAACSGGGGASVGESRTGGDFLALKTDPVNGATIFLNDPISIDFSSEVDVDSANLTTMTFQALDQAGNPTTDLVTGSFTVATSPGDASPGRRLNFVPRFATNNDFSNGGFKSGRTYLVRLVGGQANNGNVLRDTKGSGLEQPITFRFSTNDGTQPQQLFRNPASGGPVRTNLSVSTATDLDAVPLGLFGAPPLEVRLDFNQALNPQDINVPVSLDVDPLVRDINDRGRIYLEYDDPDLGPDTWIPASIELERNNLSGATVTLRPSGVLPNNATIRVIVERTLQDISGEDNSANPAYSKVFGTFKTISGFEQQWNGIAENFLSVNSIDPGAAFPEAQAEVGPGYVKAGFEFEGNQTTLEYEPTANEVVLNTAFTQVVPKVGLPFTVNGGVFNFRNVTIPQGVTVTGTGPNPMVWLCNGKFTVAGTLSVSGGRGARVDTLVSANFAKAGGIGVCGGGNGGDGTPSATQRDLVGGSGNGPMQEAGRGGRGGLIACVGGCYTGDTYNSSGGGSGGGGGTMATQGDPNWRGTIAAGVVNPNVNNQTAFQQRLGFGGAGCSGTSEGQGTGRTAFLAGGIPGDLLFVDSRPENNFWGSAIDINRNLRITGELLTPVGGGGGGGGGDTSNPANCSVNATNFFTDYSGGGGGGGAGVLIVKALEEITITSTGKIVADGGNGGGGEQVGACGEAGGGGAGAGGMVILMSAKQIIIEAHGDASIPPNGRFVYGAPTNAATASHPYLRNDYDFAISADGGVCTTGGFGAVSIPGKYPLNGNNMLAGNQYDEEPTGGLGGMGIVQLMVPPGEDNADETNTILDDNIIFRIPGQFGDVNGPGKRQLLAWRGFPDVNGILVDDDGNPTNIGDNEGDIRPAPTLLPSPFGARSRARSRWIDTGSSIRRMIAAPDGLPRAILNANGAMQGPIPEFAGLRTDGYVDYALNGQSVAIQYPQVFPAPPATRVAVASTDATAKFLGQNAYRVTLTNGGIGMTDRYVQYSAELVSPFGTRNYAILQHTDNELLLAPGVEPLDEGVTEMRILAKFFKVVTNGSEGLGPTYAPVGGDPIPIANVRIGFALHVDPDPTDIEIGRFPADAQEFIRDFSDPALLDWIANNDARYVQWDVMFDMAYQPSAGAVPPSLNPSTPRPELHFLRLPFRF